MIFLEGWIQNLGGLSPEVRKVFGELVLLMKWNWFLTLEWNFAVKRCCYLGGGDRPLSDYLQFQKDLKFLLARLNVLHGFHILTTLSSNALFLHRFSEPSRAGRSGDG